MLKCPLEQMGHGIYSFSFCLNCYTFLRTVSLSSVLSDLASDCCRGRIEMLSSGDALSHRSQARTLPLVQRLEPVFTSTEGSVVAVFLHCHTLQFKVILSPCSQATEEPSPAPDLLLDTEVAGFLRRHRPSRVSQSKICYTLCCEKATCNHSS